MRTFTFVSLLPIMPPAPFHFRGPGFKIDSCMSAFSIAQCISECLYGEGQSQLCLSLERMENGVYVPNASVTGTLLALGGETAEKV